MEEKAEKAFLLWGVEQQRLAVEKIAEEQTRTFDRIRSRLTTFLPVLTTLSLGTMAGAVSKGFYAPVCSFLTVGFIASALCCVMGLRTNHGFVSATLSREIVEEIIAGTRMRFTPQLDATRIIALHVDKKFKARGKALRADRRWLQRTIWGMLLTPVVSLALFLLFLKIEKLC